MNDEERVMQDSPGHPFFRPGRMNTYAAYGIGFFAAWAVLLAICAATVPSKTMGYICAIFGGTVIGWTSATIARVVYPPPKKRQRASPSSFFQGFREN
jgi:hypothetical protein